MSGFVSGGTVDAPVERDDVWLKAQQEIEAKRLQKQDEGRQENGKSLYETLQANKAAKQDAFEEAIRLKNQFRALDEDEVDFLDSVSQQTRAREDAVRRETAEQLNLFRQQRELKEKQALGGDAEEAVVEESWTTNGKKRKRVKAGPAISGVKLRKSSSTAQSDAIIPAKSEPAASSLPAKTANTANSTTVDEALKPATMSTSPPKPVKSPSPPTTSGLGLAAYSSDED